MAADAQAAADFYGTPWGAVAGTLVRERLSLLWPDLTGMDVLGLGFAPPYLRAWRHQVARCIAATPAQVGATRWPVGEPKARHGQSSLVWQLAKLWVRASVSCQPAKKSPWKP